MEVTRTMTSIVPERRAVAPPPLIDLPLTVGVRELTGPDSGGGDSPVAWESGLTGSRQTRSAEGRVDLK